MTVWPTSKKMQENLKHEFVDNKILLKVFMQILEVLCFPQDLFSRDFRLTQKFYTDPAEFIRLDVFDVEQQQLYSLWASNAFLPFEQLQQIHCNSDKWNPAAQNTPHIKMYVQSITYTFESNKKRSTKFQFYCSSSLSVQLMMLTIHTLDAYTLNTTLFVVSDLK